VSKYYGKFSSVLLRTKGKKGIALKTIIYTLILVKERLSVPKKIRSFDIIRLRSYTYLQIIQLLPVGHIYCSNMMVLYCFPNLQIDSLFILIIRAENKVLLCTIILNNNKNQGFHAGLTWLLTMKKCGENPREQTDCLNCL